MERKRKLLASTILLLAFIAFFVGLFVYVGSPPPAKWIEKCFYYDVDNEYFTYPPIEGLPVTFGYDDVTLWTKATDACGCVEFGSGLPDGTYWMNWTWGGEPYRETYTIDCSQLVWHFDNYLPAKGGGTLLSFSLGVAVNKC